MEKEMGLVRLFLGHALAMAYLHRAAAVLDGYLYRQGTAELELTIYRAATDFGIPESSDVLKRVASVVTWLDFQKTKCLLVIN